jgi:2-phospho-L-lactate transferase/gluconeogenesis factor (CofD/UPF0052 family)
MKKIVVIGGGTGNFSVLKGLKNYDVDLSAIVSMADDGAPGFCAMSLGFYLPAMSANAWWPFPIHRGL